MIGVITQGRMGNQMFQYAFIYSKAKELDTSFFITDHSSLHYFELYSAIKKRNNKNIFIYFIKNLFCLPDFKQKKILFNSNIAWLKGIFLYKNKLLWDTDFERTADILPTVSDNTVYQGFFQSENYFKKYSKELYKSFAIKGKYSNAFNKKYESLYSKKTISIHLRRGDYVTFGASELGGLDLTLPLNYYKKCLHLINNKENYNIIFVSDDIEFFKTKFGNAPYYFFVSNDEITDFQLLLNADIAIISNSSFSWWAAWLNTKPDKTIYAPEYYLGFKVDRYFPKNIRVDKWNWINVN